MEETKKQVCKLARLARLSLTRGEEEELAGRMEEMVGYLHTLAQVEVGAEQDTPSAIPLRPDQVEPSLAGDKLLAQAPRVWDGYVVTPRSVGEGGGE